jgi:hypothetical protein
MQELPVGIQSCVVLRGMGCVFVVKVDWEQRCPVIKLDWSNFKHTKVEEMENGMTASLMRSLRAIR